MHRIAVDKKVTDLSAYVQTKNPKGRVLNRGFLWEWTWN